jgi:hypothetical protein
MIQNKLLQFVRGGGKYHRFVVWFRPLMADIEVATLDFLFRIALRSVCEEAEGAAMKAA